MARLLGFNKKENPRRSGNRETEECGHDGGGRKY